MENGVPHGATCPSVGFRRFFRNRQLANYNSLGDHFLSIPLYPIFSHQVWVKIGYPNNWMVNTVNNTTNGYTDIPICGPIFNIHPHIPAIPSSGAATIPAAGRFFGVRSPCEGWHLLRQLNHSEHFRTPKNHGFPIIRPVSMNHTHMLHGAGIFTIICPKNHPVL